MEPDRFRPGNILYSNRDTLKSLDPDRWAPHSIAGRDRKSGYQEGKGFNAHFNFMTSFYQFNSTTVVIANTSNDCVRTVNRITNTHLGYPEIVPTLLVLVPLMGHSILLGFQVHTTL